MRILVAGIGNIFMGDDAFGCEVAGELARRTWPEGVLVKDFGIRSYDLAYALMDGWDAVIMIDAMPRGERPGTVSLLEPDAREWEAAEGAAPDAHGMNPLVALKMARSLEENGQKGGKAAKGRVYVVGCEPGVLEAEEIALSEAVREAVPGAVEMVEELIRGLLETRGAGMGNESILRS